MSRAGLVIELLTVCEWNGQHMKSMDVLNPTWDQVEDAIRALMSAFGMTFTSIRPRPAWKRT